MTSGPPERDNLSAYALFAGVLATAGLPIYLHAPKFFFDEYGVGLGALGSVLFALRLLDVVQDPVLGWISGRIDRRRGVIVAFVGVIMAVAMVGGVGKTWGSGSCSLVCAGQSSVENGGPHDGNVMGAFG